MSRVAPNGSDASGVGLTPVELADARTVARVRPLRSTADDARLCFTGESSLATLKVGGPALLSLTLQAEVSTDGCNVTLAADIDTLADAARELWLRIADQPGAVDNLAGPRSPRPTKVPTAGAS